ncbi:MAG: hypothetical protein WC150_07440 [Bacteroidia bacterium]
MKEAFEFFKKKQFQQVIDSQYCSLDEAIIYSIESYMYPDSLKDSLPALRKNLQLVFEKNSLKFKQSMANCFIDCENLYTIIWDSITDFTVTSDSTSVIINNFQYAMYPAVVHFQYKKEKYNWAIEGYVRTASGRFRILDKKIIFTKEL